MCRLDGKLAIVTGAGSGMGRAAAMAMMRQGAMVVAVDIDASGLARLAEEADRDRLWITEADVSDSGVVGDLVSETERRFGAVNVLSTCAAVARPSSFLDMTAQDWRSTMAVNAFGVATVAQAAIPAMQRSGGGSIITWGSIGSVVAEEGFAAYCASKGAVLMLTKTIALEHAKDRIRVNCLCPGMVDTAMARHHMPSDADQRAEFMEEMTSWQPLGMGKAEQLASIAVFLASDESSFMTGSVVMADGGFTAM
ncbi:SDR family oxidoreductase [Spirillospora sp. NBC_00431]